MVNKWEEQQLKWGGAKGQNKVAQVPGSRESQFCKSQEAIRNGETLALFAAVFRLEW